MPIFEIELGNGAKYEVDAPDEGLAANGLFEELYKSWSPDDLEMYKIKNRDAFSDYIIDKRAPKNEGESDADYVKRRYGGLNTAGAAWERSNPTAAGAAVLLQGVPFAGEWTDEGLGKAAAVLYGGNPEDYTNTVRGARDQFELNNPNTSTGLKIGGAVAGTLPALAFAPEAIGGSLLTRLVGGGVVGSVAGAGEGYVSGYGAGTDPTSRAQLAKERAASGAIIGGGLGVAAPIVSAGARRVLEPVSDFITTRSPLRRMGIDRPAYEILDRATAADEALVGPGANRIATGGPNAMVADAGPSTRALLDTALQKSGPATAVGRRRIEDRAANEFSNINNALDQSLGPYQGVAQAARGFRDTTAAARGQAYDAAYTQRIRFGTPQTRTLQALMRRVPASAVSKANELMRLEGHRNQVVGGFIDANGRFNLRFTPSIRQIDYITRGLRQLAEAGEDAGKLGGRTDVSRALTNLSRDIRNQARQLVPEYGVALDTAAAPIAGREALLLGEGMLTKMTRSQLAEEIRGMSAAELRSVQQGLRAHVDEIISKTKQAMTDTNMDARQAATALRELSSPANREKISMILGRPQSERLFQQLDQSSQAIELRANVAQNSKTFARQDMNETVRALNEDGLVAATRRGEVGNILKRTWQTITGGRKIDDQMREDQIYQQIVEFLTGPRGANAQTQLQVLRDVAARGPAGREIASRLARDIGITGAVGTYTAGMDVRNNAIGRGAQ
jgi:hypothetical protein